MIDTKLLSEVIDNEFRLDDPDPNVAYQALRKQIEFRNESARRVARAIEGLDALTREQQGAYITAHPELMAGVAYAPNLVSADMIDEAIATPFMATPAPPSN